MTREAVSIHAPLERRATRVRAGFRQLFQSTLPSKGRRCNRRTRSPCFNPRSPPKGQQSERFLLQVSIHSPPRLTAGRLNNRSPPREAATFDTDSHHAKVSIAPPPKGERQLNGTNSKIDVSIRSPPWRRRISWLPGQRHHGFNPLPSKGDSLMTGSLVPSPDVSGFNPAPPPKGQRSGSHARRPMPVSIRSPPGATDGSMAVRRSRVSIHAPLRKATHVGVGAFGSCFNPAPLRKATSWRFQWCAIQTPCFNPRSPLPKERVSIAPELRRGQGFNPRSPPKGSDREVELRCAGFQSLPSERRRPLQWRTSRGAVSIAPLRWRRQIVAAKQAASLFQSALLRKEATTV